MKKVLINLGKAVCYTLVFIIAQSAAVFIANIVFVVKLGLESYEPYGSLPPFDELLTAALGFTSANAVLLTALGDLLALLLVWLFFRIRRKKLTEETHCVGVPRGETWPVLLCALGLSTAVGVALNLLPIPETLMQEYAQASADLTTGSPWMILLGVVLIAPVAEEVYFRGLAYTRLKRAMPKSIAALLSAICFGVIHGTAVWIVYASVLGLIMTYIYEKGGSLRQSMIFHITFNFCGVFLSGCIEAMSFYTALCAGLLALALGVVMLSLISSRAKVREECKSLLDKERR